MDEQLHSEGSVVMLWFSSWLNMSCCGSSVVQDLWKGTERGVHGPARPEGTDEPNHRAITYISIYTVYQVYQIDGVLLLCARHPVCVTERQRQRGRGRGSDTSDREREREREREMWLTAWIDTWIDRSMEAHTLRSQ